MTSLTAHCLRFDCVALADVALPRFNGSALRGALVEVLREDLCVNKLGECLACAFRPQCAVTRLVATQEPGGERGAESPRPFTLEPIVGETIGFTAGEPFSFGATIFGANVQLLPFLLLGVRRMGQVGVGYRHNGSGRFRLDGVRAVNPVMGTEQLILTPGSGVVRLPSIPVTPAAVDARSAAWPRPAETIAVELLTPTRLIIRGALVRELTFAALMQRVFRRLTDLFSHFGDGPPPLDFRALLAEAETVRAVDYDLKWVDVESGSNRTGRTTPIGGLVGRVRYAGNLDPFLPWLLWATATHVGKDTVKGDGMMRVLPG